MIRLRGQGENNGKTQKKFCLELLQASFYERDYKVYILEMSIGIVAGVLALQIQREGVHASYARPSLLDAFRCAML